MEDEEGGEWGREGRREAREVGRGSRHGGGERGG